MSFPHSSTQLSIPPFQTTEAFVPKMEKGTCVAFGYDFTSHDICYRVVVAIKKGVPQLRIVTKRAKDATFGEGGIMVTLEDVKGAEGLDCNTYDFGGTFDYSGPFVPGSQVTLTVKKNRVIELEVNGKKSTPVPTSSLQSTQATKVESVMRTKSPPPSSHFDSRDIRREPRQSIDTASYPDPRTIPEEVKAVGFDRHTFESLGFYHCREGVLRLYAGIVEATRLPCSAGFIYANGGTLIGEVRGQAGWIPDTTTLRHGNRLFRVTGEPYRNNLFFDTEEAAQYNEHEMIYTVAQNSPIDPISDRGALYEFHREAICAEQTLPISHITIVIQRMQNVDNGDHQYWALLRDDFSGNSFYVRNFDEDRMLSGIIEYRNERLRISATPSRINYVEVVKEEPPRQVSRYEWY